MNKLQESLRRLSELEAKATPGPWKIEGTDGLITEDGNVIVCETLPYEQVGIYGENNPELIVAMRNALPRLIETIEIQQIALETLEVIESWTGPNYLPAIKNEVAVARDKIEALWTEQKD